MAGADMLPLPPHFHPLQALVPSLFTPAVLSLPAQQLAESLFDVAGFALFASFYAYAISFVFPCPPHKPLMLGEINSRMKRYIQLAGVVGVLWPAAIIASGFFLRHAVPEYTWGLSLVLPDALLLVIQIISEKISMKTKQSLPVKALIPPLYNGRRMFSLYKWLVHSAFVFLPLVGSSTAMEGSQSSTRLLWLGMLFAAAAVNYLLWAYNVFCFLLPTVVPRIFEWDVASRAAGAGSSADKGSKSE
ncbi:hypothetical protein CLOM_g11393 [Closterium sp. NIES-68]|nr:hypothetical protein CLOM_g11393 [Closterium sp. NIES-68]GJP71691.1 hypothetical protein CLOP_g2499 [Closterium sp. NIES-67]